jgi:CBS domain-containing protein
MNVKDCELIKHHEIEIGKSVAQAAKLMKEHKSRHIYVTHKKVPMGIISTIDIVDDVVAEGKNPTKTKVEEIMEYPIYACNYDEPLINAYFKIAKFNIVCLPVLKNNKIIGLLTSHEVMKHIVRKGMKK